jgi:hypothetical protein
VIERDSASTVQGRRPRFVFLRVMQQLRNHSCVDLAVTSKIVLFSVRRGQK